MPPLRVLAFECPQCHRRTSVVIDIKTAVKAFCKDCDQPMQPVRRNHNGFVDRNHSSIQRPTHEQDRGFPE